MTPSQANNDRQPRNRYQMEWKAFKRFTGPPVDRQSMRCPSVLVSAAITKHRGKEVVNYSLRYEWQLHDGTTRPLTYIPFRYYQEFVAVSDEADLHLRKLHGAEQGTLGDLLVSEAVGSQ